MKHQVHVATESGIVSTEAVMQIRRLITDLARTVDACPSADNLRLVRRFAKRGSGSSGLEFRRLAVDAASVGLR